MFCPKCNVTLPDNAISCPRCGHRWGQPQLYQDDSNNNEVLNFFVLPIGVTWQANVAGYTAIASLLLFPLAPIAVIMGIYALRDIKSRKQKQETFAHNSSVFSAIAGIVLGCIVIVGYAIIIYCLMYYS